MRLNPSQLNMARLNTFIVVTAVSLVFALVGFSYNVWRLERTETNNTVRAASFEILLQLSELEQLVYSLHYDKSPADGTPRKGWVKVGLIEDMSMLVSPDVREAADKLKSAWGEQWSLLASDERAAQTIGAAIDGVRAGTRSELERLQ